MQYKKEENKIKFVFVWGGLCCGNPSQRPCCMLRSRQRNKRQLTVTDFALTPPSPFRHAHASQNW